MAISSIGVGSNLPLAELLDNLRTSEESKLTAITTRQKNVDARISAYGQLKNELTNVSTAAKALLEDAFDSMKATVVGSDFTATATTGALAGDYRIKVNTLATTQSLAMTGQASRTEGIGSGGKISFTINGQTKEIDLATTGTSLNDIVGAINGQEDLGVRATILNNGSDAPYQLILSTTKTGTDAAVTSISVSGNTELDTLMKFGSEDSTVTESAASNALLEINGVSISSQSNTVTNVLDGVTLTLKGTSEAGNSLSVSGDSQGVKDAIKTFVDRYNEVLKKVKQVTAFDVENQTMSALTGDSLARKIQTRMGDILNTTSGSGAFSMLSQIGIRTDPISGQLKIDDAVLSKALTEKPVDVQALFRGDSGVAAKAMAITEAFTDAKVGLLVTASEGASKQRKDLDRQYTSAQARIDAQVEIYRKQFAAMDAMVAQMNTTSSYLTQQLSLLGSQKS
ncbi:flagellar filament capping protein FliD [Bordetella sp. 02P26C-1]|uniref:flagellar filament capping protein FliD n=1 Tax=Bordetella sp. 02P26C-1 TaxID=2683195 RepID=UPI0013528952|nr:flagellar filament capping protein FliD [Bordetella sp. 02P26C-1]MVW77508.1 flagellar filament capping protein FliD [Bordetella sp. 02P26C-1]